MTAVQKTEGAAKGAKKVKVLKVLSAHEGFRRAGFSFGREPKFLPLAELTKEQIKAIESEPRLVSVAEEIDAASEVLSGDAEGTQTT